MPEAKPYSIPKQLVMDAYQRVRQNRGAAGVDGESLAAFEKDLKGNLYKIWNRMSSGSYIPPPVKLVEIPKDDGRIRPLGVPTVADRVTQTVAKMVLEPLVEPTFRPICTRCGRDSAAAMLGHRLGNRSRHLWILRQLGLVLGRESRGAPH